MKQGWKVRALGEIDSIEFLRGNGLSKSVLDKEGKNECIHYGHLYTIYKQPTITEIYSRTNVQGKRLSIIGDVLIPGTTTADAMGIAIARSLNKNNVVLGGDINILRTKNLEVLADFISYYINGPAKIKLASYANGTNILHLSNRNIKQIKIPIPPLSEQQVIVKKLDACFTQINQAKTNLAQNLQNTKDLFQSTLTQIFTNQGDDWAVKTLGEVCEVIAGGDVPKNSFSKIKTQKHNIPIFTNGERNKGLYGFTDVEKIAKPSITVSARGTIGYSAIRNEPFYPAIRLIVLTPDINLIGLHFLQHAIRLITFTNSGTSIPQLTVPMVKQYKLSVPPLSKQQQIVKKLDKLSQQTQTLTNHYQNQLKSLETLKQSLLEKAFTGKLTANPKSLAKST